MTHDTDTDPDRIAVPTNGRGPHEVTTRLAPLRGEPPSAGGVGESSSSGPSDEEFSVAFSPKQMAIGFGILASLVLLLAGRARRGRGG
jgi:hypothetical protein